MKNDGKERPTIVATWTVLSSLEYFFNSSLNPKRECDAEHKKHNR